MNNLGLIIIFTPIYYKYKRKKLLAKSNHYINRVETLERYKHSRSNSFKTNIFLIIIIEMFFFFFLLRFKINFIMTASFWNILQIILFLIIPLMLVAIKRSNNNFDKSIAFFEQNYYLNSVEASLLLSEMLECVENIIVNYDKGVIIDLEKHYDFNIKTFVGRNWEKTYILHCKDQNGDNMGFALDYAASLYREELLIYIRNFQNHHHPNFNR